MKQYFTLCISLLGSTFAFAPPETSLTNHQATGSNNRKTTLDLLPGQGNQLVAAYNAGVAFQKSNQQHQKGLASLLRNFMKRMISLPFVFHRQRLAGWADGFPSVSQSHDHENAVYYPLVGFKFVPSPHDGHVIALSTTSHVACRIHTSNQDEEEVFGWYKPAYCPLDITAQDISRQPERN
jgi:hypothetical protein